MSPEQEPAENPLDTRYLARISIFFGIDPEKLLTDYSINISSGGVFVETNSILPVDTVLTVRFNLPNSDAIIYTHARVAWVNDPDNIKKSSLPSGMGIQFLFVKDPYAIRNLLEKSNFVPIW